MVKTTGQEELHHEIISELKMLRGLVRETAEGFILRKEGEIETLLAYLHSLPPAKLRAVATPCLRELHDLRLKPAKGRLKDLKKIDALLDKLLNQVIEAGVAGRGNKSSAGKIVGKITAGKKSRQKGSLHDSA